MDNTGRGVILTVDVNNNCATLSSLVITLKQELLLLLIIILHHLLVVPSMKNCVVNDDWLGVLSYVTRNFTVVNTSRIYGIKKK